MLDKLIATLTISLWFASLPLGKSFVLLDRSQSTKHHKSLLLTLKNQGNLEQDPNEADLSRRSVVVAILTVPTILPGAAFSKEFSTLIEENFDCLLDLPPVASDSVRLYFCRHGQTENNRLRKVQGARVDPPVNINGEVQAQNAGKAISRIKPLPQSWYCSGLKRAKMTAEIASSEIDSKIRVIALDLLREVDFGPVAEGQPVALAKAGMESTYARWAIGNVDYRPSSGGESGREVLLRAAESLKVLAKRATSSPNGCLAAVTHSAFLKILLGMVLDEPLADAASRKVDNGGITVIDVPRNFQTRALGSNPRLLGGILSQAPSNFDLKIPICNVVKINESRHLPLIPQGELLERRSAKS